MGLDTVSGLLRIVVNGVEVVNEEKEYFRGSDVWKPRSLVGKLAGIHIESRSNSKPHIYEYYFSVFKGSIVGKWLEYASTFSNMNIFSSVLTSEKMMEKTSPTAMEDDCVGAGDYLR